MLNCLTALSYTKYLIYAGWLEYFPGREGHVRPDHQVLEKYRLPFQSDVISNLIQPIKLLIY